MTPLSRLLCLAAGFAADRVWGDPARWHPVAGFGTAAVALERRTYADRRVNGVVHVTLLVGAAAAFGTRRTGVVGMTVATWAVLGGRSLDREAEAVQRLLEAGDLAGARQRLTHLVGRDTSELDEAGIARAVIESVAENTSDAVVAPLVWGALLGTTARATSGSAGQLPGSMTCSTCRDRG
jgi:adenosylcobinamide-phosphate synthase